jgi:ferredoxin
VSAQGRLRVDWSACDGQGLCAVWAPELVHRDEWGYPVVSRDPVPADLLPRAREAVRSCPRGAMVILLHRSSK